MRVFIILLCWFTIDDAFAQSSLGLRTGASTFYYKIPGESQSAPRLFLSVPWNMPVNKVLSVQPELGFSHRDIKLTNGTGGFELLHRESFNLDLILCPRLKLSASKLGVFFEGGPLMGLTLYEHRESGYVEAFSGFPDVFFHNYQEREFNIIGKPALEFAMVGRFGAEFYTASATIQLGGTVFQELYRHGSTL